METDQSGSNPRSNPLSKRSLKGVVNESNPAASQLGAEQANTKRAKPEAMRAEPAASATAAATAAATATKASTMGAAAAPSHLGPTTASAPKQPYLIPPKQCMISENGLLLIFVLSQEYIKELTDKEQPIEKGPLEPGVYTWVIISNQDGSAPRIYLKPSPNVQEFVSKHVDIVTCIKERGEQCNVAFAGELEVFDNDSINVNLLSGSFMEKKMKEVSQDRTTTLEEFEADADTAIRGMLGAFFSTHTVNEVDTSGTGKTFITRGLSNHDLNSFISDAIKRPEDIKIYWFGQDSKDECDRLRTILNQKFKKGIKKGIKKGVKYDVEKAKKKFEKDKRISIEEYNGQLVVIKDDEGRGYSLNPEYATAISSGAGVASAEMGGPGSAIMGGALITRRHRLRGRTRKIKRKRTTTKKKIKRNKRSNKRKKRP